VSLAEMIKPPDGVECQRWRPKKEGSKRCYYYIDGGACSLDTYFMCVEFTQKNYGFRSLLAYREEREALARLEALAARATAKTGPKLSSALAALQALKTEGQ